jgi:HAMP domain-containing protein
MSAAGRLTGFAAVLAVVFGAAFLAGRVAGPLGEPAAAAHEAHAGTASHETMADEVPAGLATSQDGYTLALAATRLAPGAAVPVSFTINGPDERPVTAFDVTHEKRLHLIAVRRDLTGFQHVHPTLDRGVWSTALRLTPGVWRLFADFTPTGADGLTLGADLTVPGRFDPAPPGPVSRTAQDDGYTVTLAGDLAAGDETVLTLKVSRGGRPVTDLEPYLGAKGHLVVLREGDLAYVHAHPDSATEPGPGVVFHVTALSAGRYHLYLDFKHGGVVRTASFTLSATRHQESP